MKVDLITYRSVIHVIWDDESTLLRTEAIARPLVSPTLSRQSDQGVSQPV